MKEVPCLVHISPRRFMLCRINCIVAGKQHKGCLHHVIGSKQIVHRFLLVPKGRLMYQKKNAHLAVCMCAVMEFL